MVCIMCAFFTICVEYRSLLEATVVPIVGRLVVAWSAHCFMGGTIQAIAGFKNSEIF